MLWRARPAVYAGCRSAEQIGSDGHGERSQREQDRADVDLANLDIVRVLDVHDAQLRDLQIDVKFLQPSSCSDHLWEGGTGILVGRISVV
jgi:hypothetical protein